jgi:hypothetical protein
VLYDTHEALANADRNMIPLLVFAGLAFVGLWTQYIHGAIVGLRHRTFSVPPGTNMFNIAHDVHFAFLFSYFFFEIDHWFAKAFYLGLLTFIPFELFQHYLTLKHGRQELFPRLTRRQFVAVYLALQAGAVVLFHFLFAHVFLVEPKLDALLMVTVSWATLNTIPHYFPLLLRRQSRRGSSMLIAWGMLIGCGLWFFPTLPLLHEAFLSPAYIAMTVLVFAMGFAYIVMLGRYPVYDPPADLRGG